VSSFKVNDNLSIQPNPGGEKPSLVLVRESDGVSFPIFLDEVETVAAGLQDLAVLLASALDALGDPEREIFPFLCSQCTFGILLVTEAEDGSLMLECQSCGATLTSYRQDLDEINPDC